MGNKPSHNVFFVQEVSPAEREDDNKPFWRQIGVAWAHKSGKGLSVKLNLIPADFAGGEIVMLKATEESEQSSEPA